MIEKIDLQGSTAITMANKVSKICTPLRNLGVSGFQYMRKFTDGRRFILCDRPELMQFFYEECFYPITWYDNDKSFTTNSYSFEFWPIKSLFNSAEQELLDQNLHNLFDISQSIAYLDKNKHFLEIFRFFSNNKSIYHIKRGVLFHFMFYFKENMQKIIEHSKQESFYVPSNTNKVCNSPSKENEDNIINLMPIKRYYLRGELSKMYLTRREKDCLHWCLQGKNSEETSNILGISKKTVENTLQKIKEKFNCYKQGQLATIAVKSDIFNS